MKIRAYIVEKLKNADVLPEEITAETNFIMRNFLNINNIYIDNEISQDKIQKLDEIFEQRKMGLPLQYILGVSDFMGEKFFVDKNVLIPRPETEILVRKTIEIANQISAKKILDIGAGSGCIGIMLAKNLRDTKITSCDISEDALEVAKKNAVNIEANVNFIKSDIFENIEDKFDIVVSNPPYIPPQEKTDIQKEVAFEPDLALYTKDKDGIEFYERIIKEAKNHLSDNGFVLFELGIKQHELVKRLFLDYNFHDVEIIKDLDNIERVIYAKV